MVGHYKDGRAKPGRKKKWVRPMLTILTREKDKQERVLDGCKNYGIIFGPPETFAGCILTPDPCGVACSVITDS